METQGTPHSQSPRSWPKPEMLEGTDGLARVSASCTPAPVFCVENEAHGFQTHIKGSA